MEFEKKIADDYEAGKIRGPIHLAKGNEKQLIEIFEKFQIRIGYFLLGEIIYTHYCTD